MQYSLDEKYNLIRKELLNISLKDPLKISKIIMQNDYINIHGPEHHFLDGGAFLTAYRNSGGDIDLYDALNILAERTKKMPGAMCGNWGICGSTSSLGAALSIIHNSGPLSDDSFYKDHMEYTSSVINEMSKIGGPRCCKRNAFISIISAVKFFKEKYGINMELDITKCDFNNRNLQCIKDKCPFYNGGI